MDMDVELSGWLWKYSIIGKSDWKAHHWRKRYVAVNSQMMAMYKDEDTSGTPVGLIEFATDGENKRAMYSTMQNDFRFSADGYNYFIGIQFIEEDTPLLLLIKCLTQPDHKQWTDYLKQLFEERPFNQTKTDFPTFDVKALDTASDVDGQSEASSSDDDELKDLIKQKMKASTSGPDSSGGKQAIPALIQARIDAKKRLMEKTSQSSKDGKEDKKSALRKKLLERQAKERTENAATTQFANLQQPVDHDSRRERVQDGISSPVFSESASEPKKSRLQEVLKARQKSKESSDIAKQLQGFTARLEKDVGGDFDETGSNPPSEAPQRSKKDVLAKARELAASRKLAQDSIDEERLHDATARAQAAEAEIETLQEQAEDERQQMKDLRSRFQQLQQQLDGQKEKSSSMEDEHRDNLQKLKDRLSEVVEEKESVRKSNQDNQQNVTDLQSESDQLRSQIDQLQSNVTTLTDSLQFETQKNTDLVNHSTAEKNKCLDSLADVTDKRIKNSDLDQEVIDKLTSDVGQLKSQIANCSTEEQRKELQNRLEEISGQVSSKELFSGSATDINSWKELAEKLLDENNVLKQQCAQWRCFTCNDNTNESDSQSCNTCGAAREEVDIPKLRRDLADKISQVSTLTQQLQEFEQQTSSLKEEADSQLTKLTLLETEKHDLALKLEEATTANEDADVAKEVARRLLREKKELQEELDESTQNHTSETEDLQKKIEQQLQESEESKSELSQLKSDLEKAMSQSQSSEEVISSLKQQLDKAGTDEEGLVDQLRSEIESLRKSLEELREQHVDLKTISETDKELITSIQSQLESNEELISSLRSQLEEASNSANDTTVAKEQIESLQKQLEESKEENQTLQQANDSADASEEVISLQKQVEELQSELQDASANAPEEQLSLQKQLEDTQTEMQSLQSELEQIKNVEGGSSDLQEQVHSLQKQLEDLQIEKDALQSGGDQTGQSSQVINQLQEGNTSLTELSEGDSNVIKVLKDEIEELQQSNESSKCRIAELEGTDPDSELSGLREANAELLSENENLQKCISDQPGSPTSSNKKELLRAALRSLSESALKSASVILTSRTETDVEEELVSEIRRTSEEVDGILGTYIETGSQEQDLFERAQALQTLLQTFPKQVSQSDDAVLDAEFYRRLSVKLDNSTSSQSNQQDDETVVDTWKEVSRRLLNDKKELEDQNENLQSDQIAKEEIVNDLRRQLQEQSESLNNNADEAASQRIRELEQNMASLNDSICELEDALQKERKTKEEMSTRADRDRENLLQKLADKEDASNREAEELKDIIRQSDKVNDPEVIEILSREKATPLEIREVMKTTSIVHPAEDSQREAISSALQSEDLSEEERKQLESALENPDLTQNDLHKVMVANGIEDPAEVAKQNELKQRIEEKLTSEDLSPEARAALEEAVANPDTSVQVLEQTLAEHTFEEESQTWKEVAQKLLSEKRELENALAVAQQQPGSSEVGNVEKDDDEETWKEVARRLLNDKKALERTLQEIQQNENLPDDIRQQVDELAGRIEQEATADEAEELQKTFQTVANSRPSMSGLTEEDQQAIRRLSQMEITSENAKQNLDEMRSVATSLPPEATTSLPQAVQEDLALQAEKWKETSRTLLAEKQVLLEENAELKRQLEGGPVRSPVETLPKSPEDRDDAMELLVDASRNRDLPYEVQQQIDVLQQKYSSDPNSVTDVEIQSALENLPLTDDQRASAINTLQGNGVDVRSDISDSDLKTAMKLHQVQVPPTAADKQKTLDSISASIGNDPDRFPPEVHSQLEELHGRPIEMVTDSELCQLLGSVKQHSELEAKEIEKVASSEGPMTLEEKEEALQNINEELNKRGEEIPFNDKEHLSTLLSKTPGDCTEEEIRHAARLLSPKKTIEEVLRSVQEREDCSQNMKTGIERLISSRGVEEFSQIVNHLLSNPTTPDIYKPDLESILAGTSRSSELQQQLSQLKEYIATNTDSLPSDLTDRNEFIQEVALMKSALVDVQTETCNLLQEPLATSISAVVCDESQLEPMPLDELKERHKSAHGTVAAVLADDELVEKLSPELQERLQNVYQDCNREEEEDPEVLQQQIDDLLIALAQVQDSAANPHLPDHLQQMLKNVRDNKKRPTTRSQRAVQQILSNDKMLRKLPAELREKLLSVKDSDNDTEIEHVLEQLSPHLPDELQLLSAVDELLTIPPVLATIPSELLEKIITVMGISKSEIASRLNSLRSKLAIEESDCAEQSDLSDLLKELQSLNDKMPENISLSAMTDEQRQKIASAMNASPEELRNLAHTDPELYAIVQSKRRLVSSIAPHLDQLDPETRKSVRELIQSGNITEQALKDLQIPEELFTGSGGSEDVLSKIDALNISDERQVSTLRSGLAAALSSGDPLPVDVVNEIKELLASPHSKEDLERLSQKVLSLNVISDPLVVAKLSGVSPAATSPSEVATKLSSLQKLSRAEEFSSLPIDIKNKITDLLKECEGLERPEGDEHIQNQIDDICRQIETDSDVMKLLLTTTATQRILSGVIGGSSHVRNPELSPSDVDSVHQELAALLSDGVSSSKLPADLRDRMSKAVSSNLSDPVLLSELCAEIVGIPELQSDAGVQKIKEIIYKKSSEESDASTDCILQGLACVLMDSVLGQQLTEEQKSEITSLIEGFDSSQPEQVESLKNFASQLSSQLTNAPLDLIMALEGKTTDIRIPVWKNMFQKCQLDKAIQDKVMARERAGSVTALQTRELDALQQGFASVLFNDDARKELKEQQLTAITSIFELDSESPSSDITKFRTAAATVLSDNGVTQHLSQKERSALGSGTVYSLWKSLVKKLYHEKGISSASQTINEAVEAKQLQEALGAWLVQETAEDNPLKTDVENLLALGDEASINELRIAAAKLKLGGEGVPKQIEKCLQNSDTWKHVTSSVLSENAELENSLVRERANSQSEMNQSIEALKTSLTTVLQTASDQLTDDQRKDISESLTNTTTPQEQLSNLQASAQAITIQDADLAEALQKGSDTWKEVACRLLDEKKTLASDIVLLKARLGESDDLETQPDKGAVSESGISELSALVGEKRQMEQQIEELQAIIAGGGENWQQIAERLQLEKDDMENQLNSVTSQSQSQDQQQASQLRQQLRDLLSSPEGQLIKDEHRKHVERLINEGSDIVTLSEALATARAIAGVKRDDSMSQSSPIRCKERVTELEGSIHQLLGAITDLEGDLVQSSKYNAAVDLQQLLAEAASTDGLDQTLRDQLSSLSQIPLSKDPLVLEGQLAELKLIASTLPDHPLLNSELKDAIRMTCSASPLQASGMQDLHEHVSGLKSVLKGSESTPRIDILKQAITHVVECKAALSQLPVELQRQLIELCDAEAHLYSDTISHATTTTGNAMSDLEQLVKDKDKQIFKLESTLLRSTLSGVPEEMQPQAQNQVHDLQMQRAANLQSTLSGCLSLGASSLPSAGLRTQIQQLVSKDLSSMDTQELHAVTGSLKAVCQAVLTSGNAIPPEIEAQLRDSLESCQQPILFDSVSKTHLKQPHGILKKKTERQVDFSDKLSVSTNVTNGGASESELEFIEKLTQKANDYENACSSVLARSEAVKQLPHQLVRQMAVLIGQDPSLYENISVAGKTNIQITEDTTDEEIVMKLRVKIAELEQHANSLESQSRRSSDVVERMRGLLKHPSLPDESKRLISSAIASDAAIVASSTAQATFKKEGGPQEGNISVFPSRVLDLESQVSELTDALASVLQCRASEQLPEALRTRMSKLCSHSNSDLSLPIGERFVQLQSAVSQVKNTSASDMLPEWLSLRLDRLIQESSSDTTNVLLKTMERLEQKITRLDGSDARTTNLIGALKSVQDGSLPEDIRRALDGVILADVAAAQRLLTESEASTAASAGASPGEAGAAALSALLRALESRIGSSEGTAVQLAEASTSASGLSNAAGIIGPCMNIVATYTHDALSAMRKTNGLEKAREYISTARQIAEAAAQASSKARSVSAALSTSAHSNTLVPSDLGVLASRLHSCTKELPSECTTQVSAFIKEMRKASVDGVDLNRELLLNLSREASTLAGHYHPTENGQQTVRVAPALYSAQEVRRSAAEMRASGAPAPASSALDEVAIMLETGDTSRVRNLTLSSGSSVVPPQQQQDQQPNLKGPELTSASATTTTTVNSAVALPVREILKQADTTSPPELKSYIASLVTKASGTVGIIADGIYRMSSDADEATKPLLTNILTACDQRTANLSSGMSTLLRSAVIQSDSQGGRILLQALKEADDRLQKLEDGCTNALCMQGVPTVLRQKSFENMQQCDGTLQTAAKVAIIDNSLAEQTKSVIRSSLHSGSVDVAIEAALTCPSLSRGTRSILQETLTRFRSKDNHFLKDLKIPCCHVLIPYTVRTAADEIFPISKDVSSLLMSSLVNTSDRCSILERAISEVLSSPDVTDSAKSHLEVLLATRDTSQEVPVDSSNYPIDASSELSVPGIRDGLTSILNTTGATDMSSQLRHRLELLAGAPKTSFIPKQAAGGHNIAQVVVLEPPGAGEWLDCTILDSVQGTDQHRIRVAALPQIHPAYRFSGRQLVVSSEHLRFGDGSGEQISVGSRVRRNPDHWKWGDQDGGSGKVGSVIEVEGNGWISVQWDHSGRRSRYRYGSENCYDVLEALDQRNTTTSATDEAGIRCAVIAALESPDADSLSEIARIRLHALTGPASPQRKISSDVKNLVEQIRRNQPSASQQNENTPSDSNAPITLKKGRLQSWITEAYNLLAETSDGIVTARGHQWVLLTQEVSSKIKEMSSNPCPVVETDFDYGKLLMVGQASGSGDLLHTLRDLLVDRDETILRKLDSLVGRNDLLLSSSDAEMQTSLPLTSNKGTTVDLLVTTGTSIGFKKRYGPVKDSPTRESKRSPPKVRQPLRPVTAEDLDSEPDPEVTRALKDLALMNKRNFQPSQDSANDQWVDYIVESTLNDPSISDLLPNNFGRDASGSVRFGTRKIDLVAVNEFAAVRIGGGYMLFSDFIKRFADTERRKLVVSPDKVNGRSASPLALVRSGRDMVFVDPQEVSDPTHQMARMSTGPAGARRPSTPRRVRSSHEEYSISNRPMWSGQMDRKIYKKNSSFSGPLPESRTATPTRRRSPSPSTRYASSASQWVGKAAPLPSVDLIDDELVEERCEDPIGESSQGANTLDLLENRLQQILNNPTPSGLNRSPSPSPSANPWRDPVRPIVSPRADRERQPSSPRSDLSRPAVDESGRRVFNLASHPFHEDARMGTIDYQSYMQPHGSQRRGSRPPVHPGY